MNGPIKLLLVLSTLLCACRHDEVSPVHDNGYPEEIEAIVVNKCSNAGCHNLASHEAAAGLNLETWDRLFEGGRAGAVVIPYRPDFSTFCYYTNIDSSLGITLQPTMPYNASPLSTAEYLTIKNWITNGAPNNKGFVKFSDYQNKVKLYVSNRGCDVITIMDPESGLAMRYIDVGTSPSMEGPCMVKVSPDKLYWYVIFNQGSTIQKFRTADNVKVGELQIGSGFWSTLTITPDSKKAFVSDSDINGRILYTDLENMQLITTYQSGLRYPYGMCINSSGDMLYVTSQEGNYIYKINISNPVAPIISEVSLETGVQVSILPTLNPHSILLSQDETRYYVTCKKSAELRVMQSVNDSLIGTFLTGSNPAEITASPDYPYVFISCLGVPGTNKLSEVNVFDVNSNQLLPEINAGHDSKGMVIHEGSSRMYVANRNVSAGGPDAHHAPVCAGKNGYITVIDLNTLQLIPDYKAELSVDPYHISNLF
jgi:DNA-binding beta-propeller fold protein YncE